MPIAKELARTNEVWAVGRFGDARVRAAMEDVGARTLRADLAGTDLPALPDVDYVLNFAISRLRPPVLPDHRSRARQDGASAAVAAWRCAPNCRR